MDGMELTDYLAAHCNQPQGNNDRLHPALLTDITKKLGLLDTNIPPSAQVYLEVVLLEGMTCIGQVDLAAYDAGPPPRLYLVEAKVDRVGTGKSRKNHRDGIQNQLTVAYDFFYRRFGMMADTFGVIRKSGVSSFEHYRLEHRNGTLIALPVHDHESMLDIADLVQHPPREK